MMTAPITSTAVTAMPAAQAGVASAVASTSRQVGMTLGVAVIGAVTGGSLAGGIGKGFASATHPGWWIIAGLAAVTLALALASTGRWATRPRAGQPPASTRTPTPPLVGRSQSRIDEIPHARQLGPGGLRAHSRLKDEPPRPLTARRTDDARRR